ncbi:MAG: peptidoglycan bridge formation glycyltransferase FemA/FemB family protein [Spirochaetales bacterium]|nr:peptidoglycan bridge formation glycyltransferase FemA/FemB family protein [Spirochaetales bacterium]
MNVPVEEIELSELSSNLTLLQSPVWATFKAGFGWDAHALRPTAGPWTGEAILVLVRRLAPGLTLAYVPYGPSCQCAPAELLAATLTDLGASLAAALPVTPVCVRFDLLWEAGSLEPPEQGGGASASLPGAAKPGRVRKAPLDVQPPSTVLIDLNHSPDELLAGMHKKNRYNIRLAERKGVMVRAAGSVELDRWYDLYRETALRDRITIHSLRYYRRLFELARDSIDLSLHLYLAEHDGDLLAGIIVAEFGDQATYLYGASSNDKRSLMPNYALQWTAILHARETGLATYDLFGVPPADDPAHPMHGLYRFKTGFGGRLVHRAGSWDVVTRPKRYGAYRCAEKARSFYFHRMSKAAVR